MKIGSCYQDCVSLCEWYDRYLNSTDEERRKMAREIWHESNEKLRHYFDLANGYLVPNRIAFFALEQQPKRVDTLGREALNNRLAHFNCPFALEKGTWMIKKRE